MQLVSAFFVVKENDETYTMQVFSHDGKGVVDGWKTQTMLVIQPNIERQLLRKKKKSQKEVWMMVALGVKGIDTSYLPLWIRRIGCQNKSLLKSFYTSGLKPALQCALLRSNPTTLSEAFSFAHATKARFAKDALSKLLQWETMTEYQNEFEILISQVTRKSESLLTTIYISGLIVALQIELLRARLTTLGEAFSLAYIIEAHFEAIVHDEKATAEKEQSIKETTDTITSLQSEVASLKAKGSLDSKKEIKNDHTLVHELEKQEEKLSMELQLKNNFREALEST
uniref:Coiled-coil domain-containing protein 18-like n=1 Tax=Tanacetum cinerariifolium TaxID=118510 RepID=A0A6L2NAA2_TANCI|nr:coiled-coil domain-containing protein 18-like [Tanacetum cinerariifolium]